MSNKPSQLTIDLAAVCGFAAGNRTKATAVIKQAMQGLGIDKLTKSLTADDKAAIVQWHKARLTDNNQLDIETIAPAVALRTDNAPTLIEQLAISREAALNEPPALSREDAIGLVDYLKAKFPSVTILALKRDADLDLRMVEKLLSHATKNNTEYSNCLQKILELFPDLSPPVINEPMETAPTHIEQVETIPPAVVEPIADDTATAERYDFNAMVQLSVYVGARKQCHIAIDGFYLNALMTMAGIDKKGVKEWIQNAVDSWGAFDPKLNITRQVRSLIVRELESELIKSRG